MLKRLLIGLTILAGLAAPVHAAGSISLSLSQQFDSLGKPLAGGKLYFYQAGTVSTPQNAYYDTALTLPLPNPVTLDAAGRTPAFYLADGQIKVRLTDKNGVNQIVQDNLLVIGPSSGGGGGGGSVDPTTVYQTGDVMWLDVSGTRTGWVRDNGRTIGSASSGATERANSDTQALFIYLWNTYSNTVCPVSTGRGASGAADFAANKTIQLPDKRGYIVGGVDDMGNSAAGRFASVPVVSGDTVTPGSVLGEATHTLSLAEIPSHSHANTATDSGHDHYTWTGTKTDAGFGGAGGGLIANTQGGETINNPSSYSTSKVKSGQANIVMNNVNAGGGGAHSLVQKTVLGSFYRKL